MSPALDEGAYDESEELEILGRLRNLGYLD
jgi:hypothetical protein